MASGGRFITLEGGEGAGKSTQARLLAARLRELGHRVVVTREPGGTPLAERVRDRLLKRVDDLTPTGQAILFAAARADHVDRLIAPALERGDLVICDRFYDSTEAYQGFGLAPSVLSTLTAVAVGETRPDLTLILDIPPQAGLARARARTGDPLDAFERDTLDVHARRRAAYLAIAHREPHRCVVLDAGREPQAVAADAFHAIATRLGL